MYKIQIQGCLPIIIILMILSFVFFVALKLWLVFAVLLLIYLMRNFIQSAVNKVQLTKEEKEKNYTPHKGEVYKICPYCGSSIKRTAEKCPHCGGSID